MMIYISGPMSGKRDHNRRAFEKAYDEIFEVFKVEKSEGRIIIRNPLAIGSELEACYDMISKNTKYKAKPRWSDYMRADIMELCNCTHALFLKGWEKSKGAALERQIAEAIGIICAESAEELLALSKEARP
jgi:hypothetical protein